jgi:hypothetical protein
MPTIDDLDLTIHNNTIIKKSATELFTDREDPQEAFEWKYKLISDDKIRKRAFLVISYYGIGGIGKSLFKDRLVNLIKHQNNVGSIIQENYEKDYILKNAYCASFDFEHDWLDKSKLSILISIRNQLVLESKGKIHFWYFDAARSVLYENMGLDVRDSKSSSLFLENNEWVQLVTEGMNIISPIDKIAAGISFVDKLGGIVKDKFSGNREKMDGFIKSLKGCSMTEILNDMHKFFSYDICDAVNNPDEKKQIDRPIVIFLDTYEKFIDKFGSVGVPTHDYWLRKDSDSLIKSTPGILWVILGREKLDWRNDNSDYWGKEENPDLPLSGLSIEEKQKLAKNLLEQHRMGDLSEYDAVDYFKRVGIKDDNLCFDLFRLTRGTPVYMDICRERYYDMLNNNYGNPDFKGPKLEDFGNDINELIERYFKYMSLEFRQMAYVMAAIKTWNDKKFTAIVNNMDDHSWYSSINYKKIIDHSFIIKDDKGRYYVHETVRDIYIKSAPFEMIQKAHRGAAQYAKSLVAENDMSEAASLIIDTVYEGADYEEAYAYWEDIIKVLSLNGKMGLYAENCNLLSNLYERVEKEFPKSEYAFCVRQYLMLWLTKNGKMKEAEKLLDDSGYSYDTNRMIILDALRTRGAVYHSLRDIKKLQNICKTLYEKLKEIKGENSIETISALNNLALSYMENGEYQKAYELLLELFHKEEDIEQKIYENNADIDKQESYMNCCITTMNNLAGIYLRGGRYRDARFMKEEVYKKNNELYGELHPETLRSKSGLAYVYIKLENYKEALDLEEETYNQKKQIFGEEHPLTFQSLDNISWCYFKMGDIQKALEIDQKVYDAFVRMYGEENLNTLNFLFNNSVKHMRLGEYQKALDNFIKIYEKRKELLGENHDDTLRCRVLIAECLAGIGEKQKALEIATDVYEKRKEILGIKHPGTRSVLSLVNEIKEELSSADPEQSDEGSV